VDYSGTSSQMHPPFEGGGQLHLRFGSPARPCTAMQKYADDFISELQQKRPLKEVEEFAATSYSHGL